jgi:RNA polymerase sigma-70 factor, ECF subfamily
MAEAAQTAGAFEKPVSEPALGAEWYGHTSAERYQITLQDFERMLRGVAQKYLPAGSSVEDTQQFCAGLHHEELVLAHACVAGHEKGWEDFLTRYREKLYDMALRIARESSAARDLADSIYGELYGLNTRDGVRVSKLSFYTGRGSLEGWLRTVLAQEFVNRYRKTKRLVSLDDSVESDDGEQRRSVPELAAPVKDEVQAPDPRLSAATDEALAALQDDERFILAAYYLDGRTLAQIAGMLRVHESTISRKVEKLGKTLRKQILSRLTQRGMSRRQAEEALEVDVRDVALDLRARLQDSGSGAFYKKRKAEGRSDQSE